MRIQAKKQTDFTWNYDNLFKDLVMPLLFYVLILSFLALLDYFYVLQQLIHFQVFYAILPY